MALIKCTECSKEISDKAKICPSCGYAPKPPKKIGCLAMIGIVAFVFFAYAVKESIKNHVPESEKSTSMQAATPTPQLTQNEIELQAKRKSFIESKIQDGLFSKIETPGNLPHLWASQRFINLDYDAKKDFANIVFTYYHTLNPSYSMVVIYDSHSGKKIGTFSNYGLMMD